MYIFKEFLSHHVLEESNYKQYPHLGRKVNVCKSRNLKSRISIDINFTYARINGYSSKYAYKTQYDRGKKYNILGYIRGKLTKRGANVCVSNKMFALL